MMHLKSLYPPLAPIPSKNLHEAIFNSPTSAIPDYVAQIDAASGKTRTRSEFVERTRDAATALGSDPSGGGMGLSGEAGDVVGICSTNCMDYITLVQACLAITTPFALISSFSTHVELVHAIRLSKVSRLFVHRGLIHRALDAASEVGLSQDRIYILEGQSDDGRQSLDDLISEVRWKQIPRVPIRPATRDTMAYLVFSSGTTGLPKGVMISHGNLWCTFQAAQMITQEEAKVVNPSPDLAVVLAVLPFHHTYGLLTFCIRSILEPYTAVIMPRWDLRLVFRAIPRYRISFLVLVPSMIHQIVTSGLLDNVDFSSVSAVASGAAYLPPDIGEKLKVFAKQLPRIAEGYGLSECTLSALRKPFPGTLGGRQPVRGSTGILLPGMEARLLRNDGTEVGFGEPGELWLKGGNIALGYFGNEQATKETFVDGWLRTGDRFRVDEQYNFFFVDRIKDTLKVSGVQVSPTEIEEILRAHPEKLLIDVCVAGVSGGRTSDEKLPRAWLVLSDEGRKKGVEETVKKLEIWSRSNLSSYKWLRGGMEVIDKIPKSPTGKVLRRQLQDLYETQRPKHTKPML